ncbi:MAG: hypothetical protein WB996_04900 [Ignavibacteriaceae bacterium]
MKTTDKINEEYLEKIISVAYGDASFIDEIKIYLDSKKNPEVRKVLDEYRETAKGLKSYSLEEYRGKIPVNRPEVNNWLLSYLNIFIRKPVLAAAMAFMITAGIAGYYIIENNNHNLNGYSQTEMILAEKQAKKSFAIVASIMDRTKNTIEKNVFGNKINKPIKKSLTIVNTYL